VLGTKVAPFPDLCVTPFPWLCVAPFPWLLWGVVFHCLRSNFFFFFSFFSYTKASISCAPVTVRPALHAP